MAHFVDQIAITASLARAFAGLIHVKEAQVKLQECFALNEHPTICEGRIPVPRTVCPR